MTAALVRDSAAALGANQRVWLRCGYAPAVFDLSYFGALAIPHCAVPGLALVHGHQTRGASLIDGLP